MPAGRRLRQSVVCKGEQLVRLGKVWLVTTPLHTVSVLYLISAG